MLHEGAGEQVVSNDGDAQVQRQLQLLVLVAVVVGRSHTKLRTVPQT